MSAIDREGLENQIHNAKALYVWGLAGIILLGHKVAPGILRESRVKFGGHTQEFKGMADRLELNQGEKQQILDNFHKVFLRFYIRESFELIKDYCEKTNQLELLQKQPWYHVARLIRNGLAHNFRWVFTKNDKKLLPLTLRTLTITEDLEGETLKLDFFNQTHAWLLHSDMLSFVENQLK